MTIHVFVSRDNTNALHNLRIEISKESIPLFISMVDRALNCWDTAPKELKELGDMLTHGRITQDHTYKPMNTTSNTDYYTPDERKIIEAYIDQRGIENWQLHVREGTTHKVLKGL